MNAEFLYNSNIQDEASVRSIMKYRSVVHVCAVYSKEVLCLVQ